MRARTVGHLAISAISASISIMMHTQTATAAPGQWPNEFSKSNSDEWLIRHHDELRVLKPNVLVVNFANGYSADDVKKCANQLADAFREGTKFHGYNQSSSPFLDYQIYKIVDLADDHKNKNVGVGGDSSKYPRRNQGEKGPGFNYPRLFANEFVGLFDVRDPRTGAQLALGEMVKQGLVNEVWIITSADEPRTPAESAELKQAYDANGNKIPGKFVRAGSGGDDKVPNIGRSLRFININIAKGPGCAMEGYCHGLESLAQSEAVPYFSKYFNEYADFDLDKRYKLPFNSFYARHGAALSYPDPTTLETTYEGRKYVVHNYVPRGNSVHFTINSRRDQDLDNPSPVMTTIEHYRQHDGAHGTDKADYFTPAVFQKYKGVSADCMGPWLTYWMQNIPGAGNKSFDDDGRHMKNWWPFLFY